MTIFLSALENTRARLIAHEATVTDQEAAEMIAKLWASKGFIVVRRVEN